MDHAPLVQALEPRTGGRTVLTTAGKKPDLKTESVKNAAGERVYQIKKIAVELGATIEAGRYP
jgi:hypothetical protein